MILPLFPFIHFFIFKELLTRQKETLDKNNLESAVPPQWALPGILGGGIAIYASFFLMLNNRNPVLSHISIGCFIAFIIFLFRSYVTIIRTITANTRSLYSLPEAVSTADTPTDTSPTDASSDTAANTESDNSVLNVNLNSATNTVVSSGVGLQHYFNLLPQKKLVSPAQNDSNQFPPVADSLLIDSLFIDTVNHQVAAQETKVRKFTLGRICHNFSYLSNKLYYNEASPYVAFYQPYDTLLNNSKTTDTTIVRAFRNTLQWNSLGYQKYNDDVPLYVYAGLTHGFYNVKRFDYQEGEMMLARNYQQLTVNGGVIVNLFKSAQIKGQAQLVTLGYQVGDFDIKAQWRQYLGTTRKNYGQVVFNFDIKRQSANWFEASYYSNHFRWDNDFKAATYLSFDLKYKFWDYCIGVRQTSIANFIYFGTDALPAQHEEMFSIREAYLSFYQKIWRFEVEGFASLQKASNEDVIHLPLVQASLKLGYAQPMFHQAATLMPSITVRYFTKYYADAYMPATRTFFLQNEVQIGNYPFIDVALAIKVKKAHIYAAYSNMMMLSKNHNSFIAPHYPMRDSKIFIGVNWRLFN